MLVAHAEEASEVMLLLLLVGGMTRTTLDLANTSLQLRAEWVLVYAKQQQSFASSV